MTENVRKGKLRICIATLEFRGIDIHGGIGAALFRLAKLLIKNNFDVTVAYANHPDCVGQPCRFELWKKKYQQMGINFIPIMDDILDGNVESENEPKKSYKTFLFLQKHEKDFDIIHFHDYLGIGYYTLLAKKLNIAFKNNLIIVQLHGTSWFVNRAQNRYPWDPSHLIMKFLEDKSIEYADKVIAPSEFYLSYLEKNNFQIRDKSVILQNVLLKENILKRDFREQTKGRKIVKVLVFFGRFAKVKGLDIFIKALDILSKNKKISNNIQKVVFLGNPEGDTIEGKRIATFFRSKAANWAFPYEVLTGKDTDFCMNYLSEEGRLAIIPSRVETSSYVVQELLHNKIPFLASNRGGIPELLDRRFTRTNLFTPDPIALSKKLIEVLEKGVLIPKPRISLKKQHSSWINYHTELVLPNKETTNIVPLVTPQVTVIMITYFPNHSSLKASLFSLRHQTFKHFDVILVDAGFSKMESSYKTKIETEFSDLKLKIIQPKNNFHFGIARNEAAKFATGKYLLFLNSDDIAKPNMLSTFVNCAENSGFEVLSDLTDELLSVNENMIQKLTWQNFHAFVDSLLSRKFDKRTLHLGSAMEAGIYQNVFGSYCLFLSKKVFLEVGGFPEQNERDLKDRLSTSGCEEWELAVKLSFLKKEIGIIPDGLVWRISWTDSKGTTKQERMEKIFVDKERCREQILRNYAKHIPSEVRDWFIVGMGNYWKNNK